MHYRELYKSNIIFSALCVMLICTAGHATFSICAVDTITKEVGSAGASCVAGAIILSDPHPGVGVVHTQAAYLSGNQNFAKNLMNQGKSPQEIVDGAVANDVQGSFSQRQYGVVDLVNNGRSAGYSGSGCQNYKGHINGKTYAIQGNILLGEEILDSMEARFLGTKGSLADKLMAALQGAKVRGADTRCYNQNKSSISAFLRVAKQDDPDNNFFLDLNVNNTSGSNDPVDALQQKYDDWLATKIKESNYITSTSKVWYIKSGSNASLREISIYYHLQEPGNTRLSIFSPSGKEITTFVNKWHAAGEYTVVWDTKDIQGKNVGKGIYILVFKMKDTIQSTKLMLTR